MRAENKDEVSKPKGQARCNDNNLEGKRSLS
jgi:hypothetical protein